MTAPAGVGVLGCGKVCPQYLPNLLTSPGLEVVAVADVLADQAKAVADQYRIPNSLTPEALIEHPDVQLVVNLTPISKHREMTAAVLAAGKHVYSEKPLTVEVSDALELLAARPAVVAAGCAPDTLLGSGFQHARAALQDGKIGAPLVATAVMLRSSLGPGPYGQGTNPFFDMAPYYVTALVNLFGPVRQVTGMSRTFDQADQGRPVWLSGTLSFDHDVVAHLTVLWGGAHRGEVPAVTIFGTDGVLQVPNPNNFGDPAFLRPHGAEAWEEVPGSRQAPGLRRNLRGLGVAELARAVDQARAPRTDITIAAHVVEVISGLVRSAETGTQTAVTSSCQPSPPLDPHERDALVRADQEPDIRG